MSVQAGPTDKRYAANGVSLIYAVPFLVIEAGDLKVYLNGVLLTSGYTHTGVGLPASTITFAVPPSGDLYLLLDVPFQRLVDYQENGDFLSTTVNRDFDRIWQALKQLFRYSTRSPMLGENDVDGAGAYRAKGNRLSDLADPIAAQDAVTRNWVGTYIDSVSGLINTTTGIAYDGGTLFDYLKTGVLRSVDTIAALRLLSSARNQRAVALGYYARGDGVVSFYAVDPADTTSADNGGSIIVGADGARWKISQSAPMTFRQWGIKFDGSNETTKVNAAIAASAGSTILVGKGTTFVDFITPISNTTVRGEGMDVSIIKRTATTAASTLFDAASITGFNLYDFTFDGNKAANANVCYGCGFGTLSYSNRVQRVRARNFKTGGFFFHDSADLANNTRSIFSDNEVVDNGGGLDVRKCARLDITGNLVARNGSTGITVANFVFPPVAYSNDQVVISDNKVEGNAGAGIYVLGHVIGGTAPAPIYGLNPPTNIHISITGNHVTGNNTYGIGAQGNYIDVSNNIIWDNGLKTDPLLGAYSGLLFNCAYGSAIGNNIRYYTGFGIDAGGSQHSPINSNTLHAFTMTGPLSSFVGINLGAASYLSCCGNTSFAEPNIPNGQHILIPGIDGDGATPFALGGIGLKVANNVLVIANSQVGIYIKRMASLCSVTDNEITGGTANNAIVNETSSPQKIEGNTSSSAFSVIPTFNNSGSIDIPDFGDVFTVTGSGAATSVRSKSMIAFNGKIRDVAMTANGVYTSKPTVTFTGGGGTGAAATAELANDGTIVGVLMINNGSAYSSAPAVGFTGGGGAGASGTAQLGCPNIMGRRITLVFQATITLNSGGNLFLVGGTYAATSGKVLTLISTDNFNWSEVSRT